MLNNAMNKGLIKINDTLGLVDFLNAPTTYMNIST